MCTQAVDNFFAFFLLIEQESEVEVGYFKEGRFSDPLTIGC